MNSGLSCATTNFTLLASGRGNTLENLLSSETAHTRKSQEGEMDAITVSVDEHRNVIEVAGPRWRRCFSIISRSY